MSRNVSKPIADALITLIQAMTVTFTVAGDAKTETISGYTWSQNGFDELPAAAVLLPSIDRRVIDQAELQIGSRDYRIEFPVEFFFDLDHVAYTQELALATVEAFIDAVDDSNRLSATVEDIVVASVAQPQMDVASKRPLIVYPTTVEVLTLVTDS